MNAHAKHFGSPSREPSITTTRPTPQQMYEKLWTLPQNISNTHKGWQLERGQTRRRNQDLLERIAQGELHHARLSQRVVIDSKG